ncbi:GNAT family N-acetyltransferase [Nodosilinea sp. AN01ver1]|uniref:GNAT family N-acetyltransferase n=1 Tax=Nodosilinea sp. AN01ver1 TaxID=3423362 RepID=UPI003D31C1A5
MGYLSCQPPSQDDIAALVALDQSALGGLWSAEAYSREIASPNSRLLMLVHRPNATGGAVADLSIASIADLQADGGKGLAPAAPGESISATPDKTGPDREPNHEPDEPEPEAPTLMGLGCYWAILDEAHITVLAIDPRYQRRGLGQWLLLNLLFDACDYRRLAPDDPIVLTRATLEVRLSNSRALALYESFGFETLGRRRRYYPDGEDALILWQNSLKMPEFRDRLTQRYSTTRHRLERQGWQIADEKIMGNRT